MSIKYVPMSQFDWDRNQHMLQNVTCINHPTARYLTKGPDRALHLVHYPEGETSECPCPASDLVVMTWTPDPVS